MQISLSCVSAGQILNDQIIWKTAQIAGSAVHVLTLVPLHPAQQKPGKKQSKAQWESLDKLKGMVLYNSSQPSPFLQHVERMHGVKKKHHTHSIFTSKARAVLS